MRMFVLLLSIWLVSLSCSLHDCDNIPQVFSSYNEAAAIIERTNFGYKDHISTKKSSWIKSASFRSCDKKTGFFLMVTNSGKKYIFQDMPFTVWVGFKEAGSFGAYYNQFIRGKYSLKLVAR